MATKKTLTTRIQHKTDTSTNWAKATNFIPLKGELIYYSDLNKLKVGDGTTKVSNLKFIADGIDDLAAEIAALDADKQDKLTAGNGITISGSTISSKLTFTLNGSVLTITSGN